MRRMFLMLFGSLLLVTSQPTPALAQRGALIEDLFRTVAEAQLEREQRKRLERQMDLKRVPDPAGNKIEPIPFPGSRNDRQDNRGTINTSNRQVAELARRLVEFNSVITPLIGDLRRAAPENPAIRQLLPEAYQIAADNEALLRRCDGMRSIGPLVDPYSSLDAHWRQLSFRLRALDGLSNRCRAGVRSCDQLISKMSNQLQIQPQFDRHALHDLMIIAGAHMQSLLDDLELARLNPRDAERLMHDLRLLRQQMLGEADRVDHVTYEQAIVEFNEFTTRWSQFSQRLYAINDPHIHRRLDRIRRCGDQTYELLWIPPPYNGNTLTTSAQRLELECSKLLDLLTIRAMVGLSGQDQVRLLESSHRLMQACKQFTKLTQDNASHSTLQQAFMAIDTDWNFVQATCRRLSSIQHANLLAVEHQCEDLRSVLGVAATDSPTIGHEHLMQAAASLEGSAEYFEADLKRYERYLKPQAYRKSILSATHKFYEHATRLHEALHRREKLSRLQTEVDKMLDDWQQLTRDLRDIESHGLSERRAESLRRAHQNIAPVVAQIAAALAQR